MIRLIALGLRLAFGFAVIAAVASTSFAADPPKLAGTWTWTWKDRIGETHKHTLEVEGVGAKLAAREIFDDQPAVKVSKLSLDGSTLRFTVVRDERRADYVGKVADADHIDGTVTVSTGGQADEFTWKAERRKVIPK